MGGCGAFFEDSWFQFQWTEQLRSWHISAKELLPILLAAATWSARWQLSCVVCQCDNLAVVNALNKGSARDPILAHLLRCLHFYAAHYQFCVEASHTPGKLNVAADALSWNNLPVFFSSNPQAAQGPDQPSAAAILMAAQSSLNWTSPNWRELFMTTLEQD